MTVSPASSPSICCRSSQACVGQQIYGAFQGNSYCVLHYPATQKISAFREALDKKLRDKDFNFNGVWFPDPPAFKGMHFADSTDFSDAVFNRGADFSDAVFDKKVNFNGAIGLGAGVGFSRAHFKEEVDFSLVKFSLGVGFKQTKFDKLVRFNGAQIHFGAIFESVNFHAGASFLNTKFPANVFFMYSTFGGKTYFTDTIFNSEADFSNCTFEAEVYFFKTVFHGKADFSTVTFSGDVEFNKASFHKEAIFRDAVFKTYLGFWGYSDERIFLENSSVIFQYAKIEEPDHVSFHTLTLRPHWFVNVDARKFDFTNVDWQGGLREEVKNLEKYDVLQPYRLFAITCRHLAVNAEENHRYEEASRFRYMAMEARRQEEGHGFAVWTLRWWYWLASGYGERVLRASLVLVGIWLLFSLLYTQVGFLRWEPRLTSESEAVTANRDETGAPLTSLTRSLAYSASVLTLQKPEPRTATRWAHALVILETILGPVQAALLALAIRRKFMR
jgi:uncharacterized protein YjbI with pentapeptide repeats